MNPCSWFAIQIAFSETKFYSHHEAVDRSKQNKKTMVSRRDPAFLKLGLAGFIVPLLCRSGLRKPGFLDSVFQKLVLIIRRMVINVVMNTN
jgi:hypothetical protein